MIEIILNLWINLRSDVLTIFSFHPWACLIFSFKHFSQQCFIVSSVLIMLIVKIHSQIIQYTSLSEVEMNFPLLEYGLDLVIWLALREGSRNGSVELWWAGHKKHCGSLTGFPFLSWIIYSGRSHLSCCEQSYGVFHVMQIWGFLLKAVSSLQMTAALANIWIKTPWETLISHY